MEIIRQSREKRHTSLESEAGLRLFFYTDRRNDRDLLELERTGVISPEEAMYCYVMRYAADSAWYYYRCNFGNYFRYNHIPVPDFSTNVNGLKIIITGGIP